MPRNIEIKAAVADLPALRTRAEALCGAAAERIDQDDSFFVLPPGRGRLKLREFVDGRAELIHYARADSPEAKASDYVRVPVAAAEVAALREALIRALGLAGRVRKQRWLLLHGRTRIHLDQVEGLGSFMELEVVLAGLDGAEDGPAEPAQEAAGRAEAQALMHTLGLADAPRLAGAYLDLFTTDLARAGSP
jgi:adenylate cyclase class IV